MRMPGKPLVTATGRRADLQIETRGLIAGTHYPSPDAIRQPSPAVWMRLFLKIVRSRAPNFESNQKVCWRYLRLQWMGSQSDKDGLRFPTHGLSS